MDENILDAWSSSSPTTHDSTTNPTHSIHYHQDEPQIIITHDDTITDNSQIQTFVSYHHQHQQQQQQSADDKFIVYEEQYQQTIVDTTNNSQQQQQQFSSIDSNYSIKQQQSQSSQIDQNHTLLLQQNLLNSNCGGENSTNSGNNKIDTSAIPIALATLNQRYACPTCGRDYSQLKNMRRHWRLECNSVPRFPCPYCKMRFKRNNQLRNHMRSRHLVKK